MPTGDLPRAVHEGYHSSRGNIPQKAHLHKGSRFIKDGFKDVDKAKAAAQADHDVAEIGENLYSGPRDKQVDGRPAPFGLLTVLAGFNCKTSL